MKKRKLSAEFRRVRSEIKKRRIKCRVCNEEYATELHHIIADKSSPSEIHYEYEWIVTLEIPAYSRKESLEKLKKFKSELFNRYGVTNDVWLTGIRRR